MTCELREYQSATQTVTCHARRQIAMQPHGEPELVGDLPQNLKKVSSDLDLVFVDFLRPAIPQSLFPGAGQASPFANQRRPIRTLLLPSLVFIRFTRGHGSLEKR